MKRSVITPAKAATTREASTPLKASNVTPRQALNLAARGELELPQGALESLLADMVLDADRRARELGEHYDGLVHVLLTAPDGLSPQALLQALSTFGNHHRAQCREARKTLELLARIIRPGSPRVRIAAVGQVNVADQQIVGVPKDLGHGHDDR